MTSQAISTLGTTESSFKVCQFDAAGNDWSVELKRQRRANIENVFSDRTRAKTHWSLKFLSRGSLGNIDYYV